MPGPVAGMLLLLVALMLKGSVSAPLRSTTQGMLDNLSLLFVPAGIGVMAHLSRLAQDWWAILVVLTASTAP